MPKCSSCSCIHILGSSKKSKPKYEEPAGCKLCLLPRSVCGQSPGARREMLPAGGARIFPLQMPAILCPWSVDSPSICSLKENCLLRIEPQGHTLTSLCIGEISSPRAFINHRCKRKIPCTLVTTLPQQEGLINELKFQRPLKYTRLIIFREMLMALDLLLV